MFMHGKLLTAAKTIKKIDKTVNLQVHLDVQVQLKVKFHPFPVCLSCTVHVFLQYVGCHLGFVQAGSPAAEQLPCSGDQAEYGTFYNLKNI